MAKGQKRSNREIRKPKAEKATVAAFPAAFGKGMLATTNAPKKKG